ncbi:ABC transporter permease [Oleiharenicola sp. Vm1]|uniref:ABC transporter permease n=1 Tax=Oleiharenicola sp. Vm1 TaxID=3398393 RepID=UPI0039F49AA1
MKLWTKLRHLLGRRARVARLEEEMRTHIEQLTEENVRRGLDRVEARRQAHLAFGNVLATREETEDALGWPSLEAWVHDFRVAGRSLSRRPAFALSLVAVLALGIGATTAVFSLVRGVLLEPLPVPHPEELSLVTDATGEPFLLSAPTIRRLAEAPELGGRVAAYATPTRAALRLDDQPAQPCQVQFVNGQFFSALGIAAARGRVLAPADDATEAPRAVAVASHAFWLAKLGGAPDAVGRSVRLNRQEVTIVGIAPASFDGVSLGDSPDLWLPLGLHAPLGLRPSAWTISDGPVALEQWTRLDNVNWLSALVRVAPGNTAAHGALERSWRPQLDAALAIITDAPTIQDFRNRVPRLVPSPQGYSDTRNDFRRVGLTLTLLVAAVVLVTAANSATLLLLRMLGRGRELGVRLALGAGRWRLARGALLESLLLACGGAVGGGLIGAWLTPLLARWLAPDVRGGLPGFDWAMAGALAVLALGLGLAIGLAPAWLMARLAPQSVLQQRHLGAGGTLRLGRTLIVAQLALSVMLISVAGALAFDLRRVLAEAPGYDRAALVQTFFDLRGAGIPEERQPALLARLRATAHELPQVREVAFAASGALSGSRSASGVYFRGEVAHQPRENIQHESVDENYFTTMGMTLVRGRGFTAHDVAGRPNVAVISERLAREVFGDADPIGRRFGFGETADAEDREIVGIVSDARVNGVREAPPAMFYDPLPQWRATAGCLVVRVAGDAAAAREALKKKISAAEPGVLFNRWTTLEERAQRWVRNDVATVRLTAGFGVLATLLAVIGVLGALGYLVASRSREIAVRLAIGAEPGRVWRDVLRDAATLGLLGAAIGVGLSLLLPRVLGSWMMVGLRADGAAIALAAVAGLLAAVIGGLLPARRAAKVDPLALLRAE